jgi:hypothetical protein
MLLGETEAILFLTQLQPQAVVVVETTTGAPALLAEAVAVAVVVQVTMQVAVAEELGPLEGMQQCHHLLVANTVLELLGKDIQEVEAVATFIPLDKVAAG